jgi:hypothetical protein
MMKLSYAGASTLEGGLTISGAATIQGLTVGRGTGAILGNTAVGVNALSGSNSGTGLNTAVGAGAMGSNTSGAYNTAIGGQNTLYSNTTGSNNVAIGNQALLFNTTASNNTAVGYQAGYSNSTGTGNTFFGTQAGYSSTGSYNAFLGAYAGYSSTGSGNTFVGINSTTGNGAGYNMTTGTKNAIFGGYSGNQSGLDIRTASNYIVLSDGDGNPRIWVTNSNVVYAPGIYANTSANSANVVAYGSGGDLYRSTSALKYKQDVRDLPSIDIGKFRAVVYKSKCANDDQTIDHFGLIADEVDEAGVKELVNYGDDGQVENFKYDRFTVVLLKAIQEQQELIKSLTARIAALEAK